jgi:hypothetical protein
MYHLRFRPKRLYASLRKGIALPDSYSRQTGGEAAEGRLGGGSRTMSLKTNRLAATGYGLRLWALTRGEVLGVVIIS